MHECGRIELYQMLHMELAKHLDQCVECFGQLQIRLQRVEPVVSTTSTQSVSGVALSRACAVDTYRQHIGRNNQCQLHADCQCMIESRVFVQIEYTKVDVVARQALRQDIEAQLNAFVFDCHLIVIRWRKLQQSRAYVVATRQCTSRFQCHAGQQCNRSIDGKTYRTPQESRWFP
jgi:hypothetical protein